MSAPTTNGHGDRMRIAVFGSTGATGRELIRLALERGYSVTAAARDPGRLATAHERLAVRRADVLDPDSVATAVAGADAVLSAVGSGSGRAPTRLYSTGVANILDAMRAASARRFVAISAAPVASRSEASPLERSLLFPIANRFFGGAYRDMRHMEKLLDTSELEWTILRPPRLTDKPATGHYRTARYHLRGGRQITRGDLAAAMLDVLHDPTGLRATIGIAN